MAELRSVIAHRPLNFPSQVRIAELQGFLDTISPNYLHGLEGKLELVKNLDFGTLKRDNSCLQTRVPLGVVYVCRFEDRVCFFHRCNAGAWYSV